MFQFYCFLLTAPKLGGLNQQRVVCHHHVGQLYSSCVSVHVASFSSSGAEMSTATSSHIRGLTTGCLRGHLSSVNSVHVASNHSMVWASLWLASKKAKEVARPFKDQAQNRHHNPSAFSRSSHGVSLDLRGEEIDCTA